MTMANEQRLRVIIEAVDRASQTIRSISHRLSFELRQIGRRMVFIGGIVLGFAALAVQASSKQRDAQLQLKTIVDAQGDSYDKLADRVTKTITEQDKLSKFTKTELLGALIQGVTGVGDLDGALRLLPAAVAFASGTGKSVQEAMKDIVEAINGDEGSRKALREFGIDVGGAKTNIMDLTTAIQKKYGPAVSEANTATAKLSKAINDLRTAIGELLEPFLSPVAEILETIAVNIGAWAKEHPKLAGVIGASLVIFGTLATVLGAILLLVAAVTFIASSGLAVAILIVIAAVIALIAAGVALWLNWGTIKEKAVQLWTFLKDNFWKTVNEIIDMTEHWANAFISAINVMIAGVNLLIRGLNLVNPFSDIPSIPSIPHISIPRLATGAGTLEPPVASGVLTAIGPGAGIVPGGNINVTVNADNSIIGVDDIRQLIVETIRNAATGGGFNRVFEGR